MKLQLKAHRVAPANYTIPASTLRTFARWRHLNGRHLIPARYSFIDSGRMKGWVGLVGWPSGRCTHVSGHTSAADQVEARESSSVETDVLTTQPTNHYVVRCFNSEGKRGALGPEARGEEDGEEAFTRHPTERASWALTAGSGAEFYRNLIFADRFCWQQVTANFLLFFLSPKSGVTGTPRELRL